MAEKGTRAGGSGRVAFYRNMEKQLHNEFLELRKAGKVAKAWWFCKRGKQILDETNLNHTISSFQWLKRFKRRNGISLRRQTHRAQKTLAQLEGVISAFHAMLLRLRRAEAFTDADIANIDQVPLPFVMDDGVTYEEKGAKEVWTQSGSSGLDKRQATVQLTVFADGIPRVLPTIIFKGTGKRIPKTETDQYDNRVWVMWQSNAWCDENIMKEWISTEWNNPFTNPPTAGSSGKLLVADVHHAQQTNDVKAALRRRSTKLSNVPPGCTSRVQVLDVSVDKPFKTQIREQFEEHLNENMER